MSCCSGLGWYEKPLGCSSNDWTGTDGDWSTLASFGLGYQYDALRRKTGFEFGNPSGSLLTGQYGFKQTATGDATALVDGFSAHGPNGKTVSFTYGSDGIRTSKTVDGYTHQYILEDGLIRAETIEDGPSTHYRFYYFDEAGRPVGFTEEYLGTYFYLKNLQGDVIGLVNTSGQLVAEYTYDSWGKVTSVTANDWSVQYAANLNPYRYRGYFYDRETGLYYVGSRYYDPEVGRWINADGLLSTGQGTIGNNMFAYCLNNPVNRIDITGEFGLLFWVVVTAITISVVVNHVDNGINYANIEKKIQPSYTQEEAKNAIVPIVQKYDAGSQVSFDDAKQSVKITNSNQVTSKYDRQMISSILSRTEGYQGRSAYSYAAEWKLHNDASRAFFGIKGIYDRAKDVDLDAHNDGRWYVRLGTVFYMIIGVQ